jgi:hypothetical protein
MIKNRIELTKDGAPKVLLTWHMPDPEGLFFPIALQFAEDLDDALRQKVLEVAVRPLKVPEKQNRVAYCGTEDHFVVLAHALARIGFRARAFGIMQGGHPLADRPIVVLPPPR